MAQRCGGNLSLVAECLACCVGYNKRNLSGIRIMSTYSLDLLARRGTIAGIEAYQRHLSPRKGFACPHRVLYQSASCADYMKRVLARHSFADAIQIAPRRFRACHRAASTLQSQMSRQEGRCIVIPCCIPI